MALNQTTITTMALMEQWHALPPPAHPHAVRCSGMGGAAGQLPSAGKVEDVPIHRPSKFQPNQAARCYDIGTPVQPFERGINQRHIGGGSAPLPRADSLESYSVGAHIISRLASAGEPEWLLIRDWFKFQSKQTKGN